MIYKLFLLTSSFELRSNNGALLRICIIIVFWVIRKGR